MGFIQCTVTDVLLGHVEVMRVVEFVWEMRIVLVCWRVDELWMLVVGIWAIVVDLGLMGWRVKRRWGVGFVGGRREVLWDWDLIRLRMVPVWWSDVLALCYRRYSIWADYWLLIGSIR